MGIIERKGEKMKKGREGRRVITRHRSTTAESAI